MLRLMFRSSTERLATVRCPKLDSCHLPHCLFNHSKRALSVSAESPLDVKRVRMDIPSPAISTPEPHSSQITNGDSQQDEQPVQEEDLKVWTPIPLPSVGAPATVQQRMRYIAALIGAYEKHKVVTPRKTAVQREFEIARSSSVHTYNNKMKQFIQKAKINVIHYFKAERGNTRTLSQGEIYDAVKKLVHPVEILKRNKYVTEVPSEEYEIPSSKKCDRCGGEFLLNEILKVKGCKFHERRVRYEKNDKYWECCSQVVGESQGCKRSEHHVFKASTPEEMHALIPFRKTPISLNLASKAIVGLDCEMGYTSKGMELIRLTVMDFYTGRVMFDEVVKPSGTVLDLNTTWSGVSSIPQEASTLDEMLSSVLGDVITKDTIIIGHGLENDLNTLRLVHHQVVDTAILYPKSLTKKYGLKELAFQFLDRKIQTGEHSSEEDSLAAIDIVKARIARTDV